MQISTKDFQKLQEEHSQVSEKSSQIATQATEILRSATFDFTESIEKLKKHHYRELSERDRAIRLLVLAVIILSTTTIYLGSRVIINKC